MVIFVGKFFGNMVISITTHWSFRLYGPFLAGPDVDHISGIDCTSQYVSGLGFALGHELWFLILNFSMN